MNLERAAPVACEQAPAYGEALYERRRGDFARAQMAAIGTRVDTEWVRAMRRRQMTGWR